MSLRDFEEIYALGRDVAINVNCGWSSLGNMAATSIETVIPHAVAKARFNGCGIWENTPLSEEKKRDFLVIYLQEIADEFEKLCNLSISPLVGDLSAKELKQLRYHLIADNVCNYRKHLETAVECIEAGVPLRDLVQQTRNGDAIRHRTAEQAVRELKL